jgi:membrane protein YqaA with SNARE-associated domain
VLRSLYGRLVALAAGPNAIYWLGLTAFVEASVFPIPPDLLLIPMVLAAPRRAWVLALVCTLCSAAGGVLGWLIGAELFDRVALPLARIYHAEPALLHFADLFRRNGLWVILIKGLTPIPYKIVSIAAGAAHFSLPVFIAASLLTRGARFFIEAALLRQFGEPVRHFVERRLTLATSMVAVAAVAGVLAVKFL